MGTPKKRYRYAFLYTDQTYLTYELTKDDFEKVEKTLLGEYTFQTFVSVSIGLIGVANLRSVVEQKEEEPEENEETMDTADGLPALDQESYNWIKEMMGGNG